jgi:hypothetical protein
MLHLFAPSREKHSSPLSLGGRELGERGCGVQGKGANPRPPPIKSPSGAGSSAATPFPQRGLHFFAPSHEHTTPLEKARGTVIPACFWRSSSVFCFSREGAGTFCRGRPLCLPLGEKLTPPLSPGGREAGREGAKREKDTGFPPKARGNDGVCIATTFA